MNKYRAIKISIVVPVYNAGEYLRQMILSVLGQAYTNWEMILIDDGSEDDSPEIIREFASKEERIISERIENSGACVARNLGIDRSNGDYILFLDADDYLMPAGLSTLVATAGNEMPDLVFGDFLMENEKGKRIPSGREEQDRVWRKLIGDKGYQYLLIPASGCKLYKRSVIVEHHLYYPMVRIGQDLAYYLTFLLHAKTVKESLEPIYVYRWVENSISHSYDDRVLDILKVFDCVEEHYREYGAYRTYCRYCARVLQRNIIAQFRKVPCIEEKEEQKRIRRELVDAFYHIRYEKQTVCSRDLQKRLHFQAMVLEQRIKSMGKK